MPNDVYIVTRVELESLANKIRSKTGEGSDMEWVSGFEDEIDKLSLPQVITTSFIADPMTIKEHEHFFISSNSYLSNPIFPIVVTITTT